MRFLKWLLIVVVLLGVLFAGVGFLLPGRVHIERSAVIKAEATKIFPYLNNYRRFNEWSPWAERAPKMKHVFSGPEEGVGAKMAWESANSEVGSGTQEIIESTPGERVVTALDFGQMGGGRATFTLRPEATGTNVTWGFDSDLPRNPMARWFGLFLDDLVGKDYEEGLARLKAKAESGPAG